MRAHADGAGSRGCHGVTGPGLSMLRGGDHRHQTVTGNRQEERLTHSGDRKRDDVMRLVSGEERARTPVHTDRISTL